MFWLMCCYGYAAINTRIECRARISVYTSGILSSLLYSVPRKVLDFFGAWIHNSLNGIYKYPYYSDPTPSTDTSY